MQASKKTGYLSGSIRRSTHIKGKERREPVWELSYRLPNGKQSEKVLGKVWLGKGRPRNGYLTQAMAEVARQHFLDEHASAVPDDRRTFGRGCRDFLAYCSLEKGLRASTLHDYRGIAERLCKQPWGTQSWRERPLDRFSEADLAEVRSELITKGLNANTINHYQRIVRGAFGQESYGRWLLPANSPAHAWARRSIKAEAEGVLRCYTREQTVALLANAESPLDLAVWTLALEAGPRQSEIRGLLVRNVRFDKSLIEIERAITTRGGLAGTKSHRMRTVPMTDNIRATIAPFCEGRDGGTLVFEHPQMPGRPLCGLTMYRRLQDAAKRAGIPILRFHDLRHTYGTMAVEVFGVTEVQHFMGHAKIETTQRYIHYRSKPDDAAKMSALFSRESPAQSPDRAENVIPMRKAS